MKNKIIPLILAIAICLTFSGCGGSSKNNNSNVSSSASSQVTEEGKITETEYTLLRDVFTEQFRNTMTDMQKLLSDFSMNDQWWSNFDAKKNEVNEKVKTFFGANKEETKSKIPDNYKEDFENIYLSVVNYQNAINKVEEARSKTANEQATILAQATQMMNTANSIWKEQVIKK